MKTNFIRLLAGILFFQLSQFARADVLDNWITNQINTNAAGLKHVVYGNGLFVAAGEKGDGGEIYTSTNGSNWILRYSDNNAWGLTMNYSGGHFSGVGGWETAVSADGTNWTVSFLPFVSGSFGYGSLTDVTFGNNPIFGTSLYVAVGDTNGVGYIITSPDGITWLPRKPSTTPGGHISSVVYDGNKFVAVGADGFEYNSTSGTGTWTKRAFPGAGLISYANGLLISPLNNKTNVISVDGFNWSLQATGLTNQLGKVTFGNNLFLAECGVSASTMYFATSVDGTNWFQYPQPLPNHWGGHVGGGKYDVSLASDGISLIGVGTEDPAAFYSNSLIYNSGVVVGTRMTNNPPRSVVLSGLVGRNYQIQFTDAFGAGSNWRTNLALQLTNTPYVWTDATATNSARFYRGVLLP